jgi:excisionase family DNA binding protein
MPEAVAPVDLTPREVAELAGVSKRTVEKAIEEKLLPVRTTRIRAVKFGKNADARRVLGPESVAYTALIKGLSGSLKLTAVRKKHLVTALKAHRLSDMKKAKVEIAPDIRVELGKLTGDVLERTLRYVKARDAWIASVEGIKGGLPVIRGTRITVHSVEARARRGERIDDIANENPDIPREAFEAAVVFAKTHPLAGRAGASPRRKAT